MSGRPVDTPARSTVERIARAQAEAYGVPFDDVVGLVNTPTVVAVRHAAMRQIVEETDCSLLGLCWAWGCGLKEARRAFSEAPALPTPPSAPPVPPPGLLGDLDSYDAGTMRRLAQIYPQHRVMQIVLGRDPATNNDIAAWRRLGSGSAAPRSTPVEI